MPSPIGAANLRERVSARDDKGRKLGAIAVQEEGPIPGDGPAALLAVPQGSGFILNGTKTFVRNAGVADVYLVFATIQSGLTGFVVDAGTAGLSVGPRLETMGLRACPVADLSFKNVAVSETTVVGGEDPSVAGQLLSIGAVAEAAQTVGIARAAVSHAAEYAKRRVQFRHPIARLQAIQTLLAEIVTDSHMAWLGIRHAAQLIEDGAPFEAEAAMVKLFLGRFGSKMLIDAIQIEAAWGFAKSSPSISVDRSLSHGCFAILPERRFWMLRMTSGQGRRRSRFVISPDAGWENPPGVSRVSDEYDGSPIQSRRSVPAHRTPQTSCRPSTEGSTKTRPLPPAPYTCFRSGRTSSHTALPLDQAAAA